MKMNKKCIFILYLLLLLIQDKYIFYLPTIPIYPDNKDEIKIVQQYVHNRSQSDIDFHKKTDVSVAPAFADYVDESISELSEILNTFPLPYLILFFKYSINRARPKQIDNELNVLPSISANTPAYPAGHSLQAYYLEKILSQKYPQKADLFHEIAEKCNHVRVVAGLHYPSDGQFSKQLMRTFF
tara:strand:+ start:170 stop:721 length:552 start_codon:yes stop_codon:yes gene_type:complete